MNEKSTLEHFDAIVIGANIRGLVASHELSRRGKHALLIEKAPSVGGADSSFLTRGGQQFDFGFHVLDYKRAEIATQLFTEVTGGRVHRQILRRAIAMHGEVFPYASLPEKMPESLRRLFPNAGIVDELGDLPPTRENLARYYGDEFVRLIFDEVLTSYPSESRHLKFGVEESELMTNIYPWYFPRVPRPIDNVDESRAFHDKLREGVAQEIIYPEEGGFGGFAKGLLNSLDSEHMEVATGVGDIAFDVDVNTHRINELSFDGRRITADHIFWAAGWSQLCDLLDIECQDTFTDRLVLGSLVFDGELDMPYHEILVGDPRLRINRVTFPATLRQSKDALIQVEFAFPDRDDHWPTDMETWRSQWLQDLAELGVIEKHRQPLEFDFKTVKMHFNAYGMEGEALKDADPSLIRKGSNVVPLVPSMLNLNLNRYVPRTVEAVKRALKN